MSELSRLVDSADEFERDLIRAAQRDEPASRALERTLASLGAGLSVVPLAAAAAPNGKLGAAVLAKWLVTGMAIGAVTVGGAHLAGIGAAGRVPPHPEGRDAGERAPARSALSSSNTVTGLGEVSPAGPPSAASSATSLLAPRRSSGIEIEPTEARASSVAAASGTAERSFPLEAPAGRPASLDAETNLLDATRRALASGAGKTALGLLADYDRAFPTGALRPEASVLRVRALLAAGDRAGAEALGRRIIAAAPNSEHADAIRKWLARGEARR